VPDRVRDVGAFVLIRDDDGDRRGIAVIGRFPVNMQRMTRDSTKVLASKL